MLESIFKNKSSDEKPLELMIKQLDVRYAQLAIEIERLKALSQKMDKISERLKSIDDAISANGVNIQSQTKSVKTMEAIKLILQKHGELTPSELSKLIKLSRTRCNEYLKEMENIGMLVSKIDCRKKIYGIRQQ